MAEEAARQSRSNWFLWWQINHDELRKQAAEYSTLPFPKSARAGGVLCLIISIAITAAFGYFRALGFDASAYVDVGLMALLALFIGLGHRWAMIVAMIYWTLSKAMGIVEGFQSGMGASAVTQIVWWAIYMHAFYFAFRVEQLRRKPALNPEVFS